MQPVSLALMLLSAAAGIQAVDVEKSFLVSFPQGTSDSVVNAAKQMVKDAKGQITHEYSIIKGFAATAGAKVFEGMQVYVQSDGATVEEDQNVQTNGQAYLS
ncbi:hypothetical protein BD289DRAFT_368332 [Coniella lustricola]|uniref:Inhibitor I9 domain-containing protein n=1 Tax=Coniella lustricola TaxID=2025994 RepID=A0A2T3A892_9PEZI|nr:hypothetical protein BD289DRAFT_368332 [Coniella lustricola]